MNFMDFMYRAFKSYRLETDKRVCNQERRNIRKTNTALDKFQVKKYMCTISEDWILEIEQKMQYIEKAVAEERQFIRVNGETVPIEKAKKVSRDSIVHLAKHSNLITRVPENPNDTLVPDGIYIVEKLSDYAVYENRFLYMLLIQLQEFIGMRLDKIKKLRMTYTCDFAIKKEINSKMRVLSFTEEYHEERYNNPYPLTDDRSNALLQRIEDLSQIVQALLKTNLMMEVSKAPMVKPPITKTNVLKMNNNFKNALALYNFICEYKGDGYKAEEKTLDFVPLSDAQSDEFVEVTELTSFLTYKYGNDIGDILEEIYQQEEEKKRKEEAEKLLERVRRLKKKVMESGMGMEEYMMALEDRNKILEKDSEDLVLAREEIEALNHKIEELNEEIEALNRRIEELGYVIEGKNKEIARLVQRYIDDMEALKRAHALEIQRLIKKHLKEMEELRAQYEKKIEEIKAAYEQQIEELKLKHQEELDEQKNAYEAKITELRDYYEKELMDLKNEYQAQVDELLEKQEAEIEELNASHQEELDHLESMHETELENQKDDYEAQILSLNKENEEKIQELMEKSESEIAELTASHTREIDALNHDLERLQEEKQALSDKYDDTVSNLNQKIGEVIGERNAKIEEFEHKLTDMEALYKDEYTKKETEDTALINDKDAQIRKLHQENTRLEGERQLAVAELTSVRASNGMIAPSEDFTSKERFHELEAEFEAFNAFFKKEWKKTKKRIRKELLWTKEEKEANKKNPDFKKEADDSLFLDKDSDTTVLDEKPSEPEEPVEDAAPEEEEKATEDVSFVPNDDSDLLADPEYDEEESEENTDSFESENEPSLEDDISSSIEASEENAEPDAEEAKTEEDSTEDPASSDGENDEEGQNL